MYAYQQVCTWGDVSQKIHNRKNLKVVQAIAIGYYKLKSINTVEYDLE
jgi:hypothetical protein